MPGRRMAFIRRILNYTVHRASGAHSRSLPHWVTFSPECIYNGYYIEPGRKTTVATTRDSKLSLVSVDELIFSRRFLCPFVLYSRAYFYPSLHIIPLPFIPHRFSFLPLFLDSNFVSDLWFLLSMMIREESCNANSVLILPPLSADYFSFSHFLTLFPSFVLEL